MKQRYSQRHFRACEAAGETLPEETFEEWKLRTIVADSELPETIPNTYLGKACRHGHINADGLTERYIKSTQCIICRKKCIEESKALHPERYNGVTYKEYQRNYHKNRRIAEPDIYNIYRARALLVSILKENDSCFSKDEG